MAMNKKLTVKDVIQLVKGRCFNKYGRLSIHLHDCTGRCVYDLDCEIEDMPSIVWRECEECVSGAYTYYRMPDAHIDLVRANEWYGVPLKDVYEDITGCYWTNDAGQRLYCYPTPTIWTAVYNDTAFNEPYRYGANAHIA